MREIKFRAWIPDSKEMIEIGVLELDRMVGHDYYNFYDRYAGTTAYFGLQLCEGEKSFLMQYTGLKDKHGKEIYESDVILHERQSRPYSSKAKTAIVKCIVQWMDGKTYGDNIENPSSFNQNPCFIAKPIGDHESTKWGYDWSEFHDCEVIGNIYENPELCQ